MASSNEIPNLRTLLGARRGGGLRGRGRGRGGFGDSSEGDDRELRENAVKCTDQDAAGSRVSCVELGYLHDPYAKLFATQPLTRRLPLLNRGTYVRTSAIDRLVATFLQNQPGSVKQIVSLGAGTDTRYFRLLDLHPGIPIIYHELDFESNTTAKIGAIQRHPQLHSKLPNVPPTATSYYSDSYNIHAIDLRSLIPTPDGPLPELRNLKPDVPTLILSEMCLVYIPAATVQSIVKSFLTHYLEPTTPASLILYEPILPQDAFGRTMIANLRTRNIHLPTLTAYPELGDQRARLKGYGFTEGARVADTNFIWKKWVAEEEKERVARLEFLDELEELDLLLNHYCVAWGWRNGEGSVFSEAWVNIEEQSGG